MRLPSFRSVQSVLGGCLLAAIVCAALPQSAAAQPVRRAAAPYNAEAAKQVVDAFATTLRDRYADADTGAMIAAHIERRLASGAYANLQDWGQFARLLTQDLQSVNEDTHLVVNEPAAGGPGGPAGPGGPGGPGAQPHGIEEARRLEGNVGYLRMSHFLGGDAAFEAVQGALTALAGSDAMIIDLRNSRGGSGGLANFILSHFTGPDSTLTILVYDRVRDATMQIYSMAEVPGPRRPEVPLFVLVDDVTRSAAEHLPFVLQNLKRATIVGSRTAGAGRNNMGVPLPHGLSGSVSFTRVMEPGTNREWERRGIEPDLNVHPDSALDVAHREALSRIAAAASPQGRARVERVLAGVIAEQAARRATAAGADLLRYVGTYEGGQYVTVSDGRIIYQSRVAQPRVPLAPLGGGLFAAGEARYRFTIEGRAATLAVVAPDGTESVAARQSTTVPPRRR
jgi:hypothetical protein